MLSSRLPKDLSPSPFFAELERAKADSAPFIDMTVSSPVKAGLPIDLDAAVESARNGFGCWNPDAAGWKSAREADSFDGEYERSILCFVQDLLRSGRCHLDADAGVSALGYACATGTSGMCAVFLED